MNIIQITPGAGKMYCGNCFRDNALVGALQRKGHSTLMLPLYLPLTLDEADHTAGQPIFFGGINVYLEQKSEFFRKSPTWLHQLLDSPDLLKWAAGKAAKTRATDLGDLTLSMIRGEEGNQARELEQLIAWLKTQSAPDVICLSNALLVGLARRLKQELGMPVVCSLQGEDSFLDALPEPHRARAWETMVERASEVDLFIAPSHYFADLMRRRLRLPADRVRVVYNGIDLTDYSPAPALPQPPVLGYFARMCREKGLDTLIDAYRELKRRDRVKGLRLRIGGGCGPSDQTLVNELQDRLAANGLLNTVEFCPNVDRAGKLAFYRSLTALSVPALYGEAFGLYLIEALASGVPVIQPRHAAFPELIAATGGGVLCAPGDPLALADAAEALLLDPAQLRLLSQTGRNSVAERFNLDRMTDEILEAYRSVSARPPVPQPQTTV